VEIAFEISHLRTFQTSVTLTLDRIISIPYHHISLNDLYKHAKFRSLQTGNFVDGWTGRCTFILDQLH